MEAIKVTLDEGAFMPEKSDKGTGYILRTPVDSVVRDTCVIDTGVHIEIPKGYVGLLKSFEEGGGPKAPAPAAPAGKDEPDRQLRLF